MGKAKSPDYQGAAIAQGEANEGVVRDQTYANRPDQYTPWGSTSWDPYTFTDPGSGEETTRWNQTQNLSPELQDILNKQIAIQGGRSDVAGMLTGRMGGEFGTEMDWRGLSPMGQRPGTQFTLPEADIENAYQTRGRAETAMFDSAKAKLEPKFAEQRRALENKMRNQGLGPQDEAWKAQMSSVGDQENDAYNQAQWSATDAGRAESGQMFDQLMGAQQNRYDQSIGANQQNFNQMMSGSKYANQIRQQQLTEAMQKRGFSLNEINALLSGQQVQTPQMPNFSQAAAAQPAPLYQAAGDQGNFDQASQQQMIDTATGIGGMAAMSDRRLKRNIRLVGKVNGHNWYDFDYIWGVHSQGVMADEVPESYTIDIGGYKAVDYSKVLGG